MWALLIGLTVLLLFFRAFSLPYFADDYFFLTKTSVHSYTDILNWFNPLRGEFFRPLSSEVFYGLTRYTPPFFAHCIVFGVFFIGLFLLYKIVARHISSRVGLLSVFLYAVHFSHVYRLYWLATFQEVLMVTFLLLSFSLYKRRKALSLLAFTGALLSKETAIVFPVLLLVYEAITTKSYRGVLWYWAFSLVSGMVYLVGLQTVTQNANYALHFNVKLILNNLLWYGLWGWGLPSYLPHYMKSIFSIPVDTFSRYLENPLFWVYAVGYVVYFMCLGIGFAYTYAKYRRRFLIISGIVALVYIIFLLPFLPVVHRWMVRIAAPLIVISVYQAFVLMNAKRVILGVAIGVYLIANVAAVKLEEEASTYFMHKKIVENAHKLLKSGDIYIGKNTKNKNAWEHSATVSIALWNNEFARFYYPRTRLYYEHEDKKPPRSILVPAARFFQ